MPPQQSQREEEEGFSRYIRNARTPEHLDNHLSSRALGKRPQGGLHDSPLSNKKRKGVGQSLEEPIEFDEEEDTSYDSEAQDYIKVDDDVGNTLSFSTMTRSTRLCLIHYLVQEAPISTAIWYIMVSRFLQETLSSSQMAISFTSQRLVRCTNMKGLFPKKTNELCIIAEVDTSSQVSAKKQGLVKVAIPGEVDVIQNRVLIRTNAPYPQYRLQIKPVGENASREDLQRQLRENERLVVRWVYEARFESRKDLESQKSASRFLSKILRRLSKDECQPEYYIDPADLKCMFRGETVRGGMGSKEELVQHNKIDFDFWCDECNKGFHDPVRLATHYMSTHEPLGSSSSAVANDATLPAKRVYTYGDMFCGAGGMARGAGMAGLLVKYGLDCDKHAAETWRKNFPTGKMLQMRADEFIASETSKDTRVVDILHLSPPCQFFSWPKTREGRDDEANQAALFGVIELVKVFKPRIVTLEQTDGIISIGKHQAAFRTLLNMFTTIGYNVSWQVVRFANYGCAQTRKRLIIIASCPGEVHPGMPPATHSENGERGLKGHVTPRSLLEAVPKRASNHDIQRAFKPAANYKSWDWERLTNTITCNGGENSSHPSGKRSLTVRELAALQGFPNEHVFYGSEQKKQIGNAVPPVFGQALLTWIRNHLEKVDKVVIELD